MTHFEDIGELLERNPDLAERNPGLLTEEGLSPSYPATSYASEVDFQNAIIKLAKEHGWKVYHTFNSKHSELGFPDLVMLRPTKDDEFVEGLVFECKMVDTKPSKAQSEWIRLLDRVPGIRARIVRPADWEIIIKLLT